MLVIDWIIHYFGKSREGKKEAVNYRYLAGRVCGVVGIFLNILLFGIKYFVGWIVHSVSIQADAINNLTDAISNIVSIFSFHVAEKPADKEHPFGHERTEMVATLFMGFFITYLGLEMLGQSIGKIIHNEAPSFHWSSIIVLVMSILIKGVMYGYNRKYSKRYDSELLMANAIDSRNDMVGTSLVLISQIISPWVGYNLDGVTSLIISFIILFSAYFLIKDVIDQILGSAPDPKLLEKVKNMILEDPNVIEVHDIVLHSYGPQKIYATAHAEVDGKSDLVSIHNGIDTIERKVAKELNIELVTHVDPVILDDKRTEKYRHLLEEVIHSINPHWSMHDFRIEMRSPVWIDCFFDLVVGYGEKESQEEIEKKILEKLPKGITFNLYWKLEYPYS